MKIPKPALVVICSLAFLAGMLTEGGHFNGILRGPASMPNDRSPASIQRVFDFSDLEGDALRSAARHRLYNSTLVRGSPQKGEILVEVGNFVLRDDGKVKDFACGFYDRIRLEFEAEGVSVDGERPVLSIETQCRVGENINFMRPLHIPVKALLQGKPTNSELKFFNPSESVTIQLSSDLEIWPRRWTLSQIRMTHSMIPSRVLVVPAPALGGPSSNVSMNW